MKSIHLSIRGSEYKSRSVRCWALRRWHWSLVFSLLIHRSRLWSPLCFLWGGWNSRPTYWRSLIVWKHWLSALYGTKPSVPGIYFVNYRSTQFVWVVMPPRYSTHVLLNGLRVSRDLLRYYMHSSSVKIGSAKSLVLLLLRFEMRTVYQ